MPKKKFAKKIYAPINCEGSTECSKWSVDIQGSRNCIANIRGKTQLRRIARPRIRPRPLQLDIFTIILKEFNFLCWLLFPQLNPIPQITLFIFCAKLSPCLRRFLSQVHYWSLTNCSRKTREHLGEASLLRGGQPTYRHWRGPAAGEFAFTGLEINFMEISPPQIFKIIPMKIKLRGMMLGR